MKYFRSGFNKKALFFIGSSTLCIGAVPLVSNKFEEKELSLPKDDLETKREKCKKLIRRYQVQKFREIISFLL
jgi:hypothetical protein